MRTVRLAMDLREAPSFWWVNDELWYRQRPFCEIYRNAKVWGRSNPRKAP